jgi:hypothetical protein
MEIEHGWNRDEVVIEPGETEAYSYDVAIAPDTRWIQLHTLVECDQEGNENWDETTLIDLHALCTNKGD